jgi:HEPN domain-containing protein
VVKRKPDPLVLIKIAQKDFEAAKLLFERRLYPQAIYMLQQSLEKAIKASLLKLDIIEPKRSLRER